MGNFPAVLLVLAAAFAVSLALTFYLPALVSNRANYPVVGCAHCEGEGGPTITHTTTTTTTTTTTNITTTTTTTTTQPPGACQGTATYCSTYADSISCENQVGCTWNGTSCSGTAVTCDSFTTYEACLLQEGCSWSNITTTTTTTSSSTTTTTTTTAPPVQTFNASNFSCSNVGTGYRCNLSFANYLGENAAVVFYISNSNQNVIASSTYILGTGGGTQQNSYFCINAGIYYMSWEAFRSSDSSLTSPVAFSIPDQKQAMPC